MRRGPNLAKVFERLMYNQLKLIIHPRISTNQHGFLSNRNIETNLLEMSTHIHQALDSGDQLDVSYADISKAFDRVNTSLLIKKMAKFPLANETLRLFISYFSGRTQYVKCKDERSKPFDVLSGVGHGQGTILGPMFFLVLFDDSDVPDDNECDNLISSKFADDKKKALIIRKPSDTLVLQRSIDRFMKWCEENFLDPNNSKCKIISFTHKKTPIII